MEAAVNEMNGCGELTREHIGMEEGVEWWVGPAEHVAVCAPAAQVSEVDATGQAFRRLAGPKYFRIKIDNKKQPITLSPFSRSKLLNKCNAHLYRRHQLQPKSKARISTSSVSCKDNMFNKEMMEVYHC